MIICHSLLTKPRIWMDFYDFCKNKMHSRNLLDSYLVNWAYLSLEFISIYHIMLILYCVYVFLSIKRSIYSSSGISQVRTSSVNSLVCSLEIDCKNSMRLYSSST